MKKLLKLLHLEILFLLNIVGINQLSIMLDELIILNKTIMKFLIYKKTLDDTFLCSEMQIIPKKQILN